MPVACRWGLQAPQSGCAGNHVPCLACCGGSRAATAAYHCTQACRALDYILPTLSLTSILAASRYITENGIDTNDQLVPPEQPLQDVPRLLYLQGYLGELAHAMVFDDVDVRGYYVW